MKTTCYIYWHGGCILNSENWNDILNPFEKYMFLNI